VETKKAVENLRKVILFNSFRNDFFQQEGFLAIDTLGFTLV
jgi:hypothetical protein